MSNYWDVLLWKSPQLMCMGPIVPNHPSWANWRSQSRRPRMFLCPAFL